MLGAEAYLRTAADPTFLARYAGDLPADRWDDRIFDHTVLGATFAFGLLMLTFGPAFGLLAAGVHVSAYLLLTGAIDVVGRRLDRRLPQESVSSKPPSTLNAGEVDPGAWLVKLLGRGLAVLPHDAQPSHESLRDDSRIRVVVLFGGRSAEHEVSCRTAARVIRALDSERYQIVPIGISPDGRWLADREMQELLATAGPGAVPDPLQTTGSETTPALALGETDPSTGRTVVLPLLHGPMGEDGTVQGLLEMADVPYAGSGVLGSAVCVDKLMTKQLLAAAGLPQCRYFGVHEQEVDESLAERIEAMFGWPVFVKPSNLGSSLGVSKVGGPEALLAAADLALAYDERLVVEEAVACREIEVAVLGDLDPRTSLPGEVVSTHAFFDYADKYLDHGSRLVVPAELPADVAEQVGRLALESFRAVRAEGLARVDFFYEEHGRGLMVNEINTMPGSSWLVLWEASGRSRAEVVDRLIALAFERHDRRTRRFGHTPPGPNVLRDGYH